MINLECRDQLAEFNQMSEECQQQLELLYTYADMLTQIKQCKSFSSLHFLMGNMPIYPLCTYENLTQYPLETAIEMCYEGLFSAIGNIFKRIWEWIVDICKKITRFIKSFFSSDNKSLEDKINAYYGNMQDIPTGSKLKVSVIAFNFEKIFLRFSLINETLKIWCREWGPTAVRYDKAHADELPMDREADMYTSLDNFIKTNQGKAALVFLNAKTVGFTNLRVETFNNFWDTPWSDPSQILNMRNAYLDSVNICKIFDAVATVAEDKHTKYDAMLHSLDPVTDAILIAKVNEASKIIAGAVGIINKFVQLAAQSKVDLETSINRCIDAYNKAQERAIKNNQ